MNIITGYVPPDSGTVNVNGHDIILEPIEVKSSIGYLPENPPLYFDMTVAEQLDFVCGMRHIPKRNRKTEIDRVSNLANIQDVKSRKIKNLSKGYKQRVGLSQTMIGSPEFLILDEPTTGLAFFS